MKDNYFAYGCREDGHSDLCDELICELDGQCRSGCCTQVLTKDYSRCTSMLIGDYCPRALDPIHDMLDARRELEDRVKEAAKATIAYKKDKKS